MTTGEIFPSGQTRRALLAFAIASAGCCVMTGLQWTLLGRIRFKFLYWNLALAWIPLLLAMFACRLSRQKPAGRGAVWSCAAAWFIFFPNAPYIVTDFVHLPKTSWQSLWYLDLLILSSFAWTGLCLGYLSLYLMQGLVQSRFGRPTSWAFAVGVLGVSSFGIYLGRFSRWNSWDVLRNPIGLAVDSVRSLNPMTNPATLAFTATIFLFLLISYCALFAMTSLPASAVET